MVIWYLPMKIKTFEYTENYCEENIWHLCQHPDLSDFSKKVLIISNRSKNCPFLQQKSSIDQQAVWWDYHVILLASKSGINLVYDFDSTLALPSSLSDYLRLTFDEKTNWRVSDFPGFKSIEASVYVQTFFSDRSHMKDPEGNWIFSPPHWPHIESEEKLSLSTLLDFTETSQERIYSLLEMEDFGKVF